MTRADILSTVRDSIADAAATEFSEPPAETAILADDFGLDSLDLVIIQTELEDHFGIDISDEEIEALRTVGDLVDLVAGKKGVTS